MRVQPAALVPLLRPPLPRGRSATEDPPQRRPEPTAGRWLRQYLEAPGLRLVLGDELGRVLVRPVEGAEPLTQLSEHEQVDMNPGGPSLRVTGLEHGEETVGARDQHRDVLAVARAREGGEERAERAVDLDVHPAVPALAPPRV